MNLPQSASAQRIDGGEKCGAGDCTNYNNNCNSPSGLYYANCCGKNHEGAISNSSMQNRIPSIESIKTTELEDISSNDSPDLNPDQNCDMFSIKRIHWQMALY